MIEKIKSIKLSKKQQMIIILVAIFIMLLVLNLLTPLLADDYSYSLVGNEERRISSLLDIINYQISHYFNWGGRTVAHTIAQIFLIFPKWIFSIANSLMYIALIYLIYLHTKGISKEDKPIFLVFIHLGLWFLLPAFGQTCLWLVGSCNYLWTTVFILLFLWIIRKNDKDTIPKIIGIALFGIISGWTNENTSFGLIVITIGLLILQKLCHKKEKLKKYQISGLIGSIIGFIVLICAPGNFERSQLFNDNTLVLIKWMKRFIEDTESLINLTLPLLILFIVLTSIYIYNKEKINKKTYLFALGGILTTYAMILSPMFPERAWTGVIVFLMISDLQLMYHLDSIHKVFQPIMVGGALILLLLYIVSYIDASKSVLEIHNVWKYRINTIEKAHKNKTQKLKFSTYYTDNKYNPCYSIPDIGKDKNDWPNLAIEKYYNIKSITAKE